MPTFGAILYFAFENIYFSKVQIGIVLIQFMIITILLPITIFYLLLALKKVDSLMIADVKQRKFPLMLNILLLGIFSFKSIKDYYFGSLHYFLLGGLLASLLLLIGVYFNKKFSIHAVGVVSLLLYAIGLSWQFGGKFPFLIPFFILMIGFVWSSRLLLKAHTNKELFIGCLIGAFSQLVFYFKYIE